MKFRQNDGGRAAAGFMVPAGDCACRATAIAMQRDYREVYDELDAFAKQFETQYEGVGEFYPSGVESGYWHEALTAYLKPLGWRYVDGPLELSERLHLNERELPSGRIICRLSKQYAAVIDGVLETTYDCSRDEYFVYGYWQKETADE